MMTANARVHRRASISFSPYCYAFDSALGASTVFTYISDLLTGFGHDHAVSTDAGCFAPKGCYRELLISRLVR